MLAFLVIVANINIEIFLFISHQIREYQEVAFVAEELCAPRRCTNKAL